MAYLKAYIKPAYSYGWQGAPTFNTRVTDVVGGDERRLGRWSQPRHRFGVQFKHLNDEKYQQILAQFMVARGKLHGFLHLNGLNYQATDELFAVADGATSEFQLSKLSVVAGVSYSHNINALYAPAPDGSAVDTPITATINGVPTSAFTLDRDRGKIIFDTEPAADAILRWSGLFSHWVRFNNDELPFSFDQPNGRYGSIELLELRPPRVTP